MSAYMACFFGGVQCFLVCSVDIELSKACSGKNEDYD